MRPASLAVPVLALVAILMASPSPAGSGSATLTVGATVRPVATVESAATPSGLTVTAGDLARGWVDVPIPVEVRVRSNAPRGYELALTTRGPAIWLTEVRGLGDEATLYGEGGLSVRRRSPAGPRESLRLRFRFHLTGDAVAGTLPWPVAVRVRPR